MSGKSGGLGTITCKNGHVGWYASRFKFDWRTQRWYRTVYCTECDRIRHAARRLVLAAAVLALTGCGTLARAQEQPTSTPAAFVQRYASPEEVAEVAAAAEANCGKPYFGTYCKLADGTYGYIPHYP